MSERKTTEIKLRVTPAEKTAWQLAAEDEGIALSELVRREMNHRASQKPSSGYWDEFIEGLVASGQLVSHTEGEDPSVAPVSTSGGEKPVAKSWMFEARDRD